jgi:hypothetical protein
MSLKERVALGHKWLLDNRGDQVAYINLLTLDLSNVFDCVLGQTGGWGPAAPEYRNMTLGTYFDWAAKHGFALTDDEYKSAIYSYDQLTTEWLAVLS